MGFIKNFLSGTVKKDGGYVPRTESFWYALGIAGQNVSYGLVSGWFYYYCTDVAKYKLAVIGFVLTFARVWDAFNDPIGGMLIDRHRFKNGEKLRPWLKYAPIIVAICCILMFITPGKLMSSTTLQGIYMLCVYLIFDMAYTVQDVSMWGMTAVMSPDSEERHSMSQIGRIGASVGSWLPGLISVMIPIATNAGITEKNLFFIFGLVLGAGGMLVSTFTSRAQERVRSEINKEDTSILNNVSDLFKNRIVVCILISSILGGLSIAIPQVYFFKYKVHMTLFGNELDGMTLNFMYGLIVGLPGTLSMLIATKIAKKVGGMKNLMILGFSLPVIARVICYFIGYEGSKIAVVMAIMAVASIPAGLNGIAQTALFGDSVDLMEWKTGRRSEAMTFAAQTFCAKIGTALNNAVTTSLLIFLDYSAEAFESGQALSPKFEKFAWPLFILGPIVGAIGNIIPLLFINYPDSMRKQVEYDLKQRRALAEKENQITEQAENN